MPADRRIDRSACSFQYSGNKGEIDFFYFPLRELAGKMLMGGVIFRDHETAARFFVQAVNDAGSLFAANPGKACAMMEQRVHDRVRSIASPRMNNEPRRFVDNEQIAVLEKKLERNFFGLRVDLFQLRFNQPNDIASVDGVARLGRVPLQLNIARPDQSLQTSPGKLGQGQRQIACDAPDLVPTGYDDCDRRC